MMIDNNDMQKEYRKLFHADYNNFRIDSQFDPIYFIKDEDYETVDETVDVNVAIDKLKEGFNVYFSAVADVSEATNNKSRRFETSGRVDGYLVLKDGNAVIEDAEVNLGD